MWSKNQNDACITSAVKTHFLDHISDVSTPRVVNSSCWTWFRKRQSHLEKLSQLTRAESKSSHRSRSGDTNVSTRPQVPTHTHISNQGKEFLVRDVTRNSMATVAGHSLIHLLQNCTNLGYMAERSFQATLLICPIPPVQRCLATPHRTLTILQFKLYRIGDLPVWPPAGWWQWCQSEQLQVWALPRPLAGG